MKGRCSFPIDSWIPRTLQRDHLHADDFFWEAKLSESSQRYIETSDLKLEALTCRSYMGTMGDDTTSN